MSGGGSPPIEVVGGSHGLAATYARVRALAVAFSAAGDELRGECRLGVRILADGDLLESAVLSPVTFAEAEAAVTTALTGPDGLLTESLGWELDALLVEATVTAFEETDRLVQQGFEALDQTLGHAAGFALGGLALEGALTAPLWLPPALVAGGAAMALWPLLPDDLRERITAAGGDLTGDLGRDVEGWCLEHPDLVQHAINGGGGLVDGFVEGLLPGLPPGVLPLPATTEGAAGLLAGLYPPDGEPQVQPRSDLSGPAGPVALPGSLSDLMTHLEQVNDWSGEGRSGNNGTIEIQSWTDAAGTPHHIVYLPGTDDLTTLPWTQDGDVRDLPTNLVVIGGGDTAYGQGITQAMHDAGIDPADPVLVVGHSQGGMEASWLAGQGEFNVTQVVTAGSPVAVQGDPSVPMLSLENRGDLVPLLDGQDNPDTPLHVTVTFDGGGTDFGSRHDLGAYVDGAAGADASTHASITDQLQALHEQGFLTGETTPATSQAFQITRSP